MAEATGTPDPKHADEAHRGEKLWELRLYVAGQTPNALKAFENLKKIIGDLSNTERVLVGLDLRPIKK